MVFSQLRKVIITLRVQKARLPHIYRSCGVLPQATCILLRVGITEEGWIRCNEKLLWSIRG